MALIVTKTFPWKVNFKWPDNGEFVDQEIGCVFNRLSKAELLELNKDLPTEEKRKEDPELMVKFIDGVLDRVLVSVSDIELTDEKAIQLPDEEVRKWAMGDSIVSNALYLSFQESVIGRKLELGNLDAPPSSSQD